MLRKLARLALIAVAVLSVSALPALAHGPEEGIDAFLTQLPKDFDTVLGKTVQAKLDAGESLLVLDVREAEEFKAGHIEGAVNVPIRSLMQNTSQLPKDKAAPIVVVCKSGIRAAYGTMALKLMGYSNVKDLQGGMLAWEKDSLPTKK
jgi:rhodanese-related sulfurtransferase